MFVEVKAERRISSFLNSGGEKMGIRDLFKPKEDKFLKLLIDQAAMTLKGMEALEQFVRHKDEETAGEITRLEKEADELRRILIDELNRSFVTPFDREDIFALSRVIDDIIDYGNTTVDEMVILEIEPTPYMGRIVSLLREAAYEIHLATLRLKDHPNVALDHATRAKALENRVESVYREALADLFHGPKDVEHIVEMLKLRETYRHLSNAADRGDEAANIIGDIVVKMT
jgi:predicted phosphate transport protein (TIGR00153 family)